jgi:hypothetical protein
MMVNAFTSARANHAKTVRRRDTNLIIPVRE